MKMRVITIALCLLFTLSAQAELTKEEVEEIRQIVREEIRNSEKTTHALINGKISALEEKVNGLEKSIELLTKMIIGLMALTGLAIITPATVVYATSRREKIRDIVENLLSAQNVEAPKKGKN